MPDDLSLQNFANLYREILQTKGSPAPAPDRALWDEVNKKLEEVKSDLLRTKETISKNGNGRF